MVAAAGNEHASDNHIEELTKLDKIHNGNSDTWVPETEQDEHETETKSVIEPSTVQVSKENKEDIKDAKSIDVISPVRRCLNQLCRQNSRSIWLFYCIAIATSWPLVGSALRLLFGKKKLRRYPNAGRQLPMYLQ